MCLQGIWWTASLYNIDLRVTHIPGKQNASTDTLSRGRFVNNGEYTWEKVPEHVLRVYL